MSKTTKTVPKIHCERYRRHFRAFNSSEKNIYKTVRKLIVSKNTNLSRSDKSYSTCVLSSCRRSQVNTPKKIAKSDLVLNENITKSIIDYCKNCGDASSGDKDNLNSISIAPESQVKNSVSSNSIEKKIKIPITKKHTHKKNCEQKLLHQYYRNENFVQSSDSFYATNNIKKVSLNTILEHPEKVSEPKSYNMYKVYPEHSEDELGFLGPDDMENLKDLKQFRKNNYFECHSAKSRILPKGSVTSLSDHKCVYRFYLNDRLFPVPLNTDYNENIRCIECHLPLDNNLQDTNINGTVQAKVKLDGKIQDMLLILPVNNSLIVKERRKVLPLKKDEESIYFGIIKLDLNGDSIFNRNLPNDSLALRYQKGYKELSVTKKYEYDSVNTDDIIII